MRAQSAAASAAVGAAAPAVRAPNILRRLPAAAAVAAAHVWLPPRRPPSPPAESRAGFDLLSVLALVVNRPNPVIDLGPVDMASSFIVVDARKEDMPIIHASSSFEKLTGYSSVEVTGRNCRFLQSPSGVVEKGAHRQFVDNATVFQLKLSIELCQECQYVNLNYRKGGEPFVNLLTIIPICTDGSGIVTYFVGFQVDIMQQSAVMLRPISAPATAESTPPLAPLAPFDSEPDFATTMSASLAQWIEKQESAVDANQRELDVVDTLLEAPLLCEAQEASPVSFLSDKPSPKTPVSASQSAVSPASSAAASAAAQFAAPMPKPHAATSSAQKRQVRVMPLAAERRDAKADAALSDGTSSSTGSPPEALTAVAVAARSRKRAAGTETGHDLAAASGQAAKLRANSHCEIAKHHPDFVHILSSRGIILYASEASTRSGLGYSPRDLVGHNIGDYCHPGDAITLMRDLKGATRGQIVSTFARLRSKSGEYIWLQIAGHKYEMNNRKRTKCFILSGRVRQLGTLPSAFLSPVVDSRAVLVRVARTTGFILRVYYSAAEQDRAGDPDEDARSGKSIYAFMDKLDAARVAHALARPDAHGADPMHVSSSLLVPAAEPRAVVMAVWPSNPTECFVAAWQPDEAARPEVAPTAAAVALRAPVTTANEAVDVLAAAAPSHPMSLQFQVNKLKRANRRLEDAIAMIGATPSPSSSQSA
nr:blue light receptor [Polyrhizophydium stewartii]